MFGAGADVTGEGHRVPADVRRNLSVVRRHRVAIECLADVPGDVGRIGVVEQRGLVVDVADPGQPGHSGFAAARWRPWSTMPVSVRFAILSGRLDSIRNRDVRGQRVVRRSGQQRIVAVVPWRQHHLEVVIHVDHAGHRPRSVQLHRADLQAAPAWRQSDPPPWTSFPRKAEGRDAHRSRVGYG